MPHKKSKEAKARKDERRVRIVKMNRTDIFGVTDLTPYNMTRLPRTIEDKTNDVVYK